jgi:hypothetical protein
MVLYAGIENSYVPEYFTMNLSNKDISSSSIGWLTLRETMSFETKGSIPVVD